MRLASAHLKELRINRLVETERRGRNVIYRLASPEIARQWVELRMLAELPRDKPIVAYCRGPFCLTSDEAVKLLARRGFRASKLADGVNEWMAAGLPLESGGG